MTGKHGGIKQSDRGLPGHVIRRLRIGDRIQIVAMGQGLALPDFPHVRPMNLAPRLLARWGVRGHGSHLHVPVTHIVPAGVMGSGLGKQEGVFGDTDIQLSDRELRRRFRLQTLRFGDLVAVCGMDARFGASRRGGAITVGVVVHSDSNVAGHGPGVTPLLVSEAGGILPVYSPDANIAAISVSGNASRRRSLRAPKSDRSYGDRRRVLRSPPLLLHGDDAVAARDHRRARVHAQLGEDAPRCVETVHSLIRSTSATCC